MALAPFFDKVALSGASLLQGVSPLAFRNLIASQSIFVAWDSTAGRKGNAETSLEILIDLSARLYPKLFLVPIGTAANDNHLRDRLESKAKAINPLIAVECSRSVPQECAGGIVVGATALEKDIPTFYVGSSGWRVRTSEKQPIFDGATIENPLAAGAATCFGAAALFQRLFSRFLPSHGSSAELDLSLLTMEAACYQGGAGIGQVDIGHTFLIGAGAIGNAVVWSLSQLPELRGTLHVVDEQVIELSNLQRYILAKMADIGKFKTELAAESLRGSGSCLNVVPRRGKWAQIAPSLPGYHIDRMLLALDSAADRIAAQASLPKWVANAWTQPENLGVSRHTFVDDGPCVACLYLPDRAAKSKDAIYADALRATTEADRMEIRQLLYYQAPIGAAFLEKVASRFSLPSEEMHRFKIMPLEAFYVEAVCGSMILSGSGSDSAVTNLQVPMAFQSALAGILLAVELIADAGKLRQAVLPARTEVNLMGRLGRQFHVPAGKHRSGKCICQDPDFQDRYRAKYALPRLA